MTTTQTIVNGIPHEMIRDPQYGDVLVPIRQATPAELAAASAIEAACHWIEVGVPKTDLVTRRMIRAEGDAVRAARLSRSGRRIADAIAEARRTADLYGITLD